MADLKLPKKKIKIRQKSLEILQVNVVIILMQTYKSKGNLNVKIGEQAQTTNTNQYWKIENKVKFILTEYIVQLKH